MRKDPNHRHSIYDTLDYIEKQITMLAQYKHRNIISYECTHFIKKKDGVFIYIVQEFILGTSVGSISSSLGWCPESASIVAKGVLDALIFLHNKGVFHNNLDDCTVFMDNTGTIKVTDFSLVPFLLDLIESPNLYKGDFPALASLIESLSPTPHSDMREFIEICRSDETIITSDLLNHAFLRPPMPNHESSNVSLKDNSSRERSLKKSKLKQLQSKQSSISRLVTDFEPYTLLGKGGFGDVLKARKITDGKTYAIKRISFTSSMYDAYKKMGKEANLLSSLHHENIVRYHTSWIENDNLISAENRVQLEPSEGSAPSVIAGLMVEDNFSSDWLSPAVTYVLQLVYFLMCM